MSEISTPISLPNNLFAGKTAIVTGASRGVGDGRHDPGPYPGRERRATAPAGQVPWRRQRRGRRVGRELPPTQRARRNPIACSPVGSTRTRRRAPGFLGAVSRGFRAARKHARGVTRGRFLAACGSISFAGIAMRSRAEHFLGWWRRDPAGARRSGRSGVFPRSRDRSRQDLSALVSRREVRTAQQHSVTHRQSTATTRAPTRRPSLVTGVQSRESLEHPTGRNSPAH